MIKFDAFIQIIHSAVLSASKAFADENLEILETYFVSADDSEDTAGTLKPRTVLMKCPVASEKGTVMKEIKVPLIALVPITINEISEVKFRTDLEVIVDGEDLKVSFPTRSSKNPVQEQTNDGFSTSSIEIIIRPTDTPAGLKNLIQAYEKVIRSQIPN